MPPLPFPSPPSPLISSSSRSDVLALKWPDTMASIADGTSAAASEAPDSTAAANASSPGMRLQAAAAAVAVIEVKGCDCVVLHRRRERRISIDVFRRPTRAPPTDCEKKLKSTQGARVEVVTSDQV